MTLPMLAPRARDPVTSVIPEPQPALMYSESEWAAVYLEIERLYVRERLKLRYVIKYMEREHGFKATEQMYKKRFSKWGFQKYSKRSVAAVQTSKTKGRCRTTSPFQEPGSIPAIPGLDINDRLKLMFLTSVRTLSIAFFDLFKTSDGLISPQQWQPPTDHLRSIKTKEISFAFKLVIDLLDRGDGKLAGRMARKAFLLIEDMLTVEGPALIWNLLDIMHNMIILRHTQLFRMLLVHLISLANVIVPVAHPLSTMLYCLRGLVTKLTSVATKHTRASPSYSSSSRSSSTDSDRIEAAVNPWILSHAIPSLLEQAWVFNAKILFNHFYPGLIQLYCRISWDSCSINIPTDVVDAAVQWLGLIKEVQKSSAAAEDYLADGVFLSNPADEQRMLERLITPRKDASPPQSYEMLSTSSIAALQERSDLIFSKGIGFNGNTTTLFRILASLMGVKILEGLPAAMEGSSMAGNLAMKVPRFYAGSVAGAIRTLIDLNIESSGGGGLGISSCTVERLHAIMILSEYANGATDLQVVREMWLLEDILFKTGDYAKAQEVGRDVHCRLEKYVQDIPISSA